MSQTGDPFFDVLHGLQPDVDIVVLSPDEDPAEIPSGSPADAAATARGTRTTTARLLGESGLTDPTANPRTVFERWQRLRGDAHTHRVRTRIEHDAPSDAFDSLLHIRDVLREAGWAPTPVDSPTPWIVAKSPSGMRVDAAVERAQLVLTVTSAPLRLDEDPA